VLHVTHIEFAYDTAAFDVQSTTDRDPVLAALPCVPPYLSFVDATDDWFGATGLPGASRDVASFAGAVAPPPFDALVSAMSSYVSAYVNVTPGLHDTIPWSYYNCPFPTTKERSATSRPRFASYPLPPLRRFRNSPRCSGRPPLDGTDRPGAQNAPRRPLMSLRATQLAGDVRGR
jgi:hypothetical protein